VSKPKPITQKEILSGNSTTSFNRANDIRRDDDTIQNLSIGLKDIDYTIKYYFDNIIRPTIDDAGTKKPVPVIYGSPERWKNIQEDGYFRDREGKILAPVIAYKRTAIAKNKTLGSKVDGNHPQVYYTQEVKYTPKNKYDQFSKLTNRVPVKTYINTVMADYVDVTYDVVVWTDYVEQMNEIVEAIIYSEGSFWGEKERFKFRTKIDSFTNTTDALQDNERIVRTTFSLTLYGYIVPDVLAKQLSEKLNEKTYSVAEVVTDISTDDNVEVFQPALQQPSVAPTMSPPNRVTTTVDNSVVVYLGTNRALSANPTNTNTVVFSPATFLAAPTSLPETSKTSFTYFVNGQLIEPAAVASFIDNGNDTCTLTVDVSQLGFTLATSDEIVAIGKFTV
jgi:hypothetical protein